ncbi:DUF4249 domain-containing protein [Echinicola soli]|uniref:DUF4249 domain-containing protein n=1 Tax=Echinicola soli TaxID=2591634 RepID=A0A514CIT3_9BACT|nr:DUF4249 domain-containing protein [Echinicola soli]QDH79725.1 DUF4249 domain-containing protein [Echinicola soli]
MKNHNIIFYLVLSVAMFGCETVVDVDLPIERPSVVVNANFSHDSIPVAKVVFSKHILDNSNEYLPIKDATVLLSDGQNQVPLFFNEEEGIYSNTNVVINEGRRYTLDVDVPGYDRVTGTDSIPVSVELRDVIYEGENYIDEWDQQQNITLVFNDPPGENYFLVKAISSFESKYVDTEGDSVFYKNVHYVDLEAKNPVYQHEFSNYYSVMFDDKLFEGEEVRFDLVSSGSSFGEDSESAVDVYLYSVSKAYYEFYTTYGLQNWNADDPFAQPVQVFTNIQGGLGIITGRSSSVFKYR